MVLVVIFEYQHSMAQVIKEAVALLLDDSGLESREGEAVVYDFGCGDGRFLAAVAGHPSVHRVVGTAIPARSYGCVAGR